MHVLLVDVRYVKETAVDGVGAVQNHWETPWCVGRGCGYVMFLGMALFFGVFFFVFSIVLGLEIVL